jgi:hypothetical protein
VFKVCGHCSDDDNRIACLRCVVYDPSFLCNCDITDDSPACLYQITFDLFGVNAHHRNGSPGVTAWVWQIDGAGLGP